MALSAMLQALPENLPARYFQYNAAKPNIRHAIIDMAMNGAGCRDIAWSLDIRLNTVLCHLKKRWRNRWCNMLN